MLFFGMLLSLIGYPLIYAGVKGNNATITAASAPNGVPLYEKPWLVYLVPFGGAALTTVDSAGNTNVSASTGLAGTITNALGLTGIAGTAEKTAIRYATGSIP